ncbi:MAG TPA: hypothetical protein VM537_13910, partial [Anaerolineae bacterium]|nr:hypothetical protein [Anaerolineae bacterium]
MTPSDWLDRWEMEQDKRETRRTGTKEWSDSSANVSVGCSNNCLYCYAKAMMVRIGRKTPSTWPVEELKKLPAS